MIVDIERFIETERPYWEELESLLNKATPSNGRSQTLDEVKRFHYLYERVSGDLSRLPALAAGAETRAYLESLVSRAYADIHEVPDRKPRFRPLHWLRVTFPQAFRHHIRAFRVSLGVTLAGCAFGTAVIAFDHDSRSVLIPFDNLLQSPTDRVKEEESEVNNNLEGQKATGAAWYWQHNSRVSLTTLALGMTWGIGTLVLLFYNGVLLGCIAADYVLDGQTIFLIGWLLPHGSVEIPAILIAGQAGLVLARAMIGHGNRLAFGPRMRTVMPDVVTLAGGFVVLLFWAGIVEAFLSQYHEPIIPYSYKIAFGVVEVILLTWWLTKSGRHQELAS